jgi:hypothetical protein
MMTIINEIKKSVNFFTNCKICNEKIQFISRDDFWSCRDGLLSEACPLGGCVTRERAIGSVLFDLFSSSHLKEMIVFEGSPCMRGLSLWLKNNCPNYHPTGYFPEKIFGCLVNGIQNENLEKLTLPDESCDVWIHLDVLEHLFSPFEALREIYRSLKQGGVCIFTAPTYSDRVSSEQVAWITPEGELMVKGEPEYHGNPQNPEKGALVTWRYGYDLPLLIQRESGFDVEVRRWQSREIAAMGTMTEVYICRKNKY